MQVAPVLWATVSELLDGALDLPAPERESWIDALPAQHEHLKAILRELLRAHSAADTCDFLGVGPVLEGLNIGAGPALAAGDTVGPYVIEAEVAHGGMGTVYRARRSDGILKRPIALKLPNAGSQLRTLAERFAQERDILAALSHPHIARLYDAGFTDLGQPFLALEYIEGRPITNYCDEERLSLRQRLQLFQQVLRAIQYAHSHLVIHRDIKPTNVLVGADGQANLLDFGIAKLISTEVPDSPSQTQAGGALLTPDYASPEQFSNGSITTASDVYSLGVLLFELLTGERPYRLKRGSRAELEEAVANLDVIRPSQAVRDEEKARIRGLTVRGLSRQIRRDLEAIMLKALKKDPAERYPTADAFAEDIERYLNSEPVAARPDSRWYRLRRFAGRHRLALAGTGAALLALLAGGFVVLHEAQVARQQRDRALNLSARNESVKEFLTLLITEAAQAEKPVTVSDMLARSETLADAEFQRNPEDRAAVLDMLGVHFHSIGEDAKAEPLFQKALKAAEQSADAELRAELTCDHAMTVAALGNAEAARRDLHSVIDNPITSDAQAARCLQVLSYIAQDGGEAKEALKFANLALERLRRLPTIPAAEEGEFLGSIAYSQHLNAQEVLAEHNFDQALRQFAEAGREASPDAIAVRNNWAVVSNDTGNPERALELYDGTLELAARSGAGAPPTYLLANRARALELLGRFKDAQAAYAACVRVAEKLASEAETAYCVVGLASVSQELGDLAAAKKHLARAAALMAAAPAESPQALAMQLVRGRIAFSEGRLGDARTAMTASIGTHVPISLSASSLIERAEVNLMDGKLAEAAADARTGLAAARSLQGGAPHSSRTGRAWLILGRVLAAQGDLTEAAAAFSSAYSDLSNTVDASDPALLLAKSLRGTN